jgi:hypothetical protein
VPVQQPIQQQIQQWGLAGPHQTSRLLDPVAPQSDALASTIRGSDKVHRYPQERAARSALEREALVFLAARSGDHMARMVPHTAITVTARMYTDTEGTASMGMATDAGAVVGDGERDGVGDSDSAGGLDGLIGASRGAIRPGAGVPTGIPTGTTRSGVFMPPATRSVTNLLAATITVTAITMAITEARPTAIQTILRTGRPASRMACLLLPSTQRPFRKTLLM